MRLNMEIIDSYVDSIAKEITRVYLEFAKQHSPNWVYIWIHAWYLLQGMYL